MDSKLIINFLRRIKANNNRAWFQAHRDEYLAAKNEFEAGVAIAINRIAEFDDSVAYVTVKDATYRFYRDTRFSPDKSPYKHHLGAYIAAHGKKSFHGGYYIHLEPDNCMLSCGNYILSTQILTACRNEIMGNIDEWLSRVENPEFIRLFGRAGEATWGDAKGFGLDSLKTCPSGFPRDYEHIRYLRMKDFCCWNTVPASFFTTDHWLDDMADIFKTGKPMMDFINAVVDDYE